MTKHAGPRVFLVGAGPGHPGLITRRGLELLRRADVVVVDSLANPELLLETRPDVEIVRMDQVLAHDRADRRAMIDVMVELARAGGLVVRLKGGDPYLFGRGAEEVRALLDAGIACEVVPGVSSAFAAPGWAGIPLTDRDRASSVLICTGTHAADRDDVDLRAAATIADTLVILMGLRRIDALVAQLLEGGRDPSTPAAVVSAGTTARQRTVVAPLSKIATAAEGLDTPALIVVGSVVDLRETLAVVEQRPLFGRRVVVTRPRARSVKLVDRLLELGAEPVLMPTIRVDPVAPDSEGEAFLRAAGSHDGVFFTSINAVARTIDEIRRLGLDARAFAGAKLIAVGSATRAAMEEHGLRADLVPKRFSAEGIIEALGADGIRDRTFLYPRAREVRETLPRAISKFGGRLVEVVLYETVTDDRMRSRIPESVRAADVDAVTFTSPSTVRGFFDLLGDEGARRVLRAARPVSIGRTTAAALAEREIGDVIVPDRSTLSDMLDALVSALVGPPDGDPEEAP